MGDELHKLFLFEFLVHSVTFSNSTLKLDPDFLKKLGPTHVQFRADNLPPLTVSEIDFCAKDAFNSNIVKFKSGKSCLFSLGNSTVNDCELKGEVTVKRPLPPGCKSTTYCVGKSPVCLDNKFIKVLNSCGSSPLSNCTKVCLDLKNSINETVGVARLLIRLTCFGTAIVTEFQKTADDSKGFLFKGDKIVPFDPEQSVLRASGRRESKNSHQQGDSRAIGQFSQPYAGMMPPQLLMAQQGMPMQQPGMLMQQPGQMPMQQCGQMQMQQARQMPMQMQQVGQMPMQMQQFGQMPMQMPQMGQMPMIEPCGMGMMQQPGPLQMMQSRGRSMNTQTVNSPC